MKDEFLKQHITHTQAHETRKTLVLRLNILSENFSGKLLEEASEKSNG